MIKWTQILKPQSKATFMYTNPKSIQTKRPLKKCNKDDYRLFTNIFVVIKRNTRSSYSSHLFINCQSITGKNVTDQIGWFAVLSGSGKIFSLFISILTAIPSFTNQYQIIINTLLEINMPTSSRYSKTEDSNLNCTVWTMKPQI